MTKPNDGDAWKDQMFRQHASEFIQILDSLPTSIDLRAILGRPDPAPHRLAVLDLGCGSGRLLKPLSEAATVVVGLDYSSELLAHATKVMQGLSNVVLVHGDARELKNTFVPNGFDVIVRAFTSLGYFPRHVEMEILDQCALITRPGGKLVVDCFNKAWFEKNPLRVRTHTIAAFTWEERYEWDPEIAAVRCLWRYVRQSGQTIDIPFSLEGYGVEAIEDILSATGWRITDFLQDVVTGLRVSDPQARERIVAVAERL